MPVAEQRLTLECLDSLSPLQYSKSCLMGRDGPRTHLSQEGPEDNAHKEMGLLEESNSPVAIFV